MPSQRSLYASMLLVVLFWGGNYSFTKLAFGDLPPLAFTAIRFAIGSTVLWLLLRHREPGGRTPRGLWGRLIILGIIGNTLYQLCFVLGLARTTATNTSLILSAMPTVLTVSAGVLGLEQITARQRWALAIATIGVLLVIAAKGMTSLIGADDGYLAWARATAGAATAPRPAAISVRRFMSSYSLFLIHC